MNEKEKIRTDIQDRLDRFDSQLGQLESLAETDSAPSESAKEARDRILRKRAVVDRKVDELMASTPENRASCQSELTQYLNDIDTELRRALALFA
jgi:hypothetical protein